MGEHMYLQASSMVVATVFYLLPQRYVCVYICFNNGECSMLE